MLLNVTPPTVRPPGYRVKQPPRHWCSAPLGPVSPSNVRVVGDVVAASNAACVEYVVDAASAGAMSSPEASAIDRSDTNRRRNIAADETLASIATRITTPFSLHADPAPQACGFCSCRLREEPEVGTRDDPRCRTECVKARILPQLIRSKVALPAGCSPVRPLRSRT